MFKEIRPKKISEIVIEQIRQKIVDGGLKPGDKLPTERELAQKMGISRPPVREAIKQLIYGGFLETIQGSGTYVKSITGNVLPDPLKEQILFSKTSFQELAKIRTLLEKWACQEAAQYRTPTQMTQLKSQLDEMSKAKSAEEFIRLDFEFHHTIAEMSKNTIYLHLIVSISNLLVPIFEKESGKVALDSGQMKELFLLHQTIYQQIKAGDGEGAQKAMQNHMDFSVLLRERID